MIKSALNLIILYAELKIKNNVVVGTRNKTENKLCINIKYLIPKMKNKWLN